MIGSIQPRKRAIYHRDWLRPSRIVLVKISAGEHAEPEDLLRLWDRSHKTVVYITHSLDEAIVLGDRVIVMTNRPGSVKTVVDIDLPRPRNVLDMQSNDVFFATRSRIWTALREEVLTLRQRESEVETHA